MNAPSSESTGERGVAKRGDSLRRVTNGKRLQFTGVALLSLVAGLCEAAFLVVITRSAFAITDATDRIEFLGGVDISVAEAVLIALLLVVARLALGVLGAWNSARLISDVTATLRRDMARAWLSTSWAAQHDDRTGQLQELLGTFTQRGSNLVSLLLSAVTTGFNLLALLALAVVVDPLAAVVVILTVVALAQLLRPFRTAVRKGARSATTSSMDYASTLSEVSQLGLEMHVFGVQRSIGERIDAVIDEQSVVNRRLDFLRQLVPTVYAGLAYLAVVLALGVVSAADSADLRSVGAVMLVMLRSLAYGQGLQGAITGYISMSPFLDELEQRVDGYRSAAQEHGIEPVPSISTIEVQDVSFEYRPGQAVLHGLSFQILKGETIGIVGPSGSGKSTLVQLLLGLRQPSEGAIRIDGKDVGDLARDDWARRVTFVPQQPRLIGGTIADNIRFYREGVDQPEIERAARLAHIDRDVSGWPEGYLRQVGDGGNRLSGGQQQRVCIARALVERPDVLILDEPTSALDARSEVLVRETIEGLKPTTTVVIIAHRLTTLAMCDRIMVLQDGRVVAFDRPSNLEHGGGFYADALRASGVE
jgi:ATP-binding cassette subfamily B protein